MQQYSRGIVCSTGDGWGSPGAPGPNPWPGSGSCRSVSNRPVLHRVALPGPASGSIDRSIAPNRACSSSPMPACRVVHNVLLTQDRWAAGSRGHSSPVAGLRQTRRRATDLRLSCHPAIMPYPPHAKVKPQSPPFRAQIRRHACTCSP